MISKRCGCSAQAALLELGKYVPGAGGGIPGYGRLRAFGVFERGIGGNVVKYPGASELCSDGKCQLVLYGAAVRLGLGGAFGDGSGVAGI